MCGYSSLPPIVISASYKRMAAFPWFCMAACFLIFVWHLHLIASDIEDVLNAFIAERSCKEECFPADDFQMVDKILVGQFQKPHIAAVRLLF